MAYKEEKAIRDAHRAAMKGLISRRKPSAKVLRDLIENRREIIRLNISEMAVEPLGHYRISYTVFDYALLGHLNTSMRSDPALELIGMFHPTNSPYYEDRRKNDRVRKSNIWVWGIDTDGNWLLVELKFEVRGEYHGNADIFEINQVKNPSTNRLIAVAGADSVLFILSHWIMDLHRRTKERFDLVDSFAEQVELEDKILDFRG